MKRRRFLLGTAIVATGGTVAWQLDRVLGGTSLLADEAAARRIGARFAAEYPPDQTLLWRGAPPASPDAWADRLATLRREDFEGDRLVQVDGWWLAETEVRLCVWLHAHG